MASIRKTKKELKREFKKALPTMALSPRLESFTIVGTYKGYRWRLHIPTNPRKKIIAKSLRGDTYTLFRQSDFLKDFDPMKHDIMPPNDAIPFAEIGVKSLAEYKDEIKRKNQ